MKPVERSSTRPEGSEAEMGGDEGFREQDLQSIDAGLTDLPAGELVFQRRHVATATLQELWQSGEPVTAVRPCPEIRERPAAALPRVLYRREGPQRLRLRPTWDLGFSREFLKAVADIDRKLQGQILQALAYISRKPTVTLGDTVKPLGGQFKGLWRYRIGDYRLIYRPEPQSRRVILVAFLSRADAYA